MNVDRIKIFLLILLKSIKIICVNSYYDQFDCVSELSAQGFDPQSSICVTNFKGFYNEDFIGAPYQQDFCVKDMVTRQIGIKGCFNNLYTLKGQSSQIEIFYDGQADYKQIVKVYIKIGIMMNRLHGSSDQITYQIGFQNNPVQYLDLDMTGNVCSNDYLSYNNKYVFGSSTPLNSVSFQFSAGTPFQLTSLLVGIEYINQCNPICLSCTGTNANECKVCKNNKYIATDNGNICTDICNTTQGEFIDNVQPQNFCKKCLPSCLTCINSSTCETCQDRYYYIPATKKCDSCNGSCKTCSGPNNNQCDQCLTKKYISISKGRICTDSCATNSGEFVDDIQPQKYCRQCMAFCKVCQNSNSCDQCQDGYYYDSVNKLCKVCDTSCQTCNGPNDKQCLICKSNQYISIRLNSICTDICLTTQGEYNDNASPQNYCKQCLSACKTCSDSTTCLTCLDGFYKNNTQCSPCHGSCNTCNGPNNNQCITCKNNLYISISEGNICTNTCDTNTKAQYIDNSPPQQYCRLCLSSCKTCSNSTSCDSCKDGYYQNNTQCLPCDSTCETCIGPNNTDCKVCKGSNKFISVKLNNQCTDTCNTITEAQYIDYVQPQNFCRQCQSLCKTCRNSSTCDSCLDGYYLNQTNQQCQPCHSSCKTCKGPNSNECIICKNNKYISVRLGSICTDTCDAAQSEYIDETNSSQFYCNNCHPSCKTCSKANICDSCSDNQYLDSNQQCSQCHQDCQTCKGPLNTDCKTCNLPKSLQLKTQICVLDCDSNEFKSQQQCVQCDKNCATCDGPDQNSCLSCFKRTYLYNKMCVFLCPNGFQTNKTSLTCDSCTDSFLPECNLCYANCKLCDEEQISIGQCNTCYDETMNYDSINKKCSCKNAKDTRENFFQCSFQSTAVLDAYLSATDPILTIDFGSPLQIIAANPPSSLCKLIFDESTINLLGSDSKCEIKGNMVQVTLSDSSKIMENDKITLLPNKLSFDDSSNIMIQKFYKNVVSQKPIGKPKLVFEYKRIENTCNPLNITLFSIQNDAGRKFTKIDWTLTEITGMLSNQQQNSINEILLQASQNKATSLIIDPKYLPPNQNITIKVSYHLKVNTMDDQTFKIFYSRQKDIKISYLQSVYPPIYRYMSLSFYYQFLIQSCEFGSITYYKEPLDLEIVSTQPSQKSISHYNQSSFQYDISPYSLPSQKTTNITLISKLSSDNQIIASKSISVDIQVTNLFVQIVGGSNFVTGFKNKLVLKTDFRDYEIEDPKSEQNIQFQWSCSSLSSKDHICYDYNDKKILLQQGESSISLPEKLFSPYTVVVISVMGLKDSRNSASAATCFFSELDIPALEVQFQGQRQANKINLNEDLSFVLVYGGNVPSDILSYAGALLYENDVVGAVKFDFYKVKFRVWDYFTKYKLSWPHIQVRFSVYNPSFVMPSLSTISFEINIPPLNCTLTVNPLQGIALKTVFTIQYLYCTDEDLPLTYQFFYYNSAADAEQELISPWNIVRRLIQDQTLTNTIQTILPQGELLIMGQAMDSQLGITNSTITIQVHTENQSAEEYYQFTNQLTSQVLQSQSLQTNQLVSLSIIGEDLCKSTNFQYNQNLSDLKSILISNIQQLTLQIPQFSLLSTFANKIISQLSSQVFTSQQQKQLNQKDQIFNQLKLVLQSSSLSIEKDNLNPLQKNNDIQIQNIIDSFKILNSSVSLATVNTQKDFENYNDISNQIGMMLCNVSLPNQGSTFLKGNLSSILSDKITYKNTHKYLVPIDESYTDNSTAVFSYSRNNYKINIYEDTSGFQAYVSQLKNTTQDFIYSNNQLKQAQVQISNPSIKSNMFNMIYQFDNVTSSSKYKMTCLQKSDSEWNSKDCVIKKNSQDKFNCFCNSQKPTTIIEELDDMLFKNKNIETAFGEQGLLNISKFKNFYQYLVFWVLSSFTLSELILVGIGWYLDKISYKKHYVQVGIEQQQDGQLNEQNQQQQQLQEIPEIDEKNNFQGTLTNLDLNFKKNKLTRRKRKIQWLQTTNTLQHFTIGKIELNDVARIESNSKNNIQTNVQILGQNDEKIEVNSNGNINQDDQLYLQKQESSDSKSTQKNEQPSNEMISFRSQILLNKIKPDKEMQMNIYSQLTAFKKIAIFHSLLSIFYLYDTVISRPVRFTLLYIKIIHTLSISILFAGYKLLSQQIFIAFANSLILKIAYFFIIFSYKKGRIGKFISSFFQIIISLLYLYIILSVSSGKSSSESNDFLILFLVSLGVELLFTEFLLSFLKNIFVQKYFKSDDEKSFSARMYSTLDLKDAIETIDI